jgi:hypothetical protein
VNNPSRLLKHAVEQINTRAVATATLVLWTAALTLYAWQLLPHLPRPGLADFDFGETMLLALACIAFQLSAFRVGLDHLARIWGASLDPLAPADRNPTRWRTFGWAGAASWLAAIALGATAMAGRWHDSTDLIFALVIVLIPAVQCTGAAVIGPLLTHAIEERETARMARRAILDEARSARTGRRG